VSTSWARAEWHVPALNSGVVSNAVNLLLFISAADRDEGEDLLKRASDGMRFDPAGHVPFFYTAYIVYYF